MNIKIDKECPHKNFIPIPDSLAKVCDNCGIVFVDGKKWEYKSGHILEWVNDITNKDSTRNN